MRTLRPRIFILVFVLLLVLVAGLFACDKNKEPYIKIQLDGEVYRGAELDLSAEVSRTISSTVQFEIVEGKEFCYIYDKQLKVLNSAVVGADIVIKVSSGIYSETLRRTIRHTPVSSVEIAEVAPLAAGAEVTLLASITPAYADDNDVTFTLTAGSEYAAIDDGVLTLSPYADASHVVEVVAETGGVRSAPRRIPISTVQATGLSLAAFNTLKRDGEVSTTEADLSRPAITLRRGDSTEIRAAVTPANATVGVEYAKVRGDFADLYVSLTTDVSQGTGTVTVSGDAPEGRFEVRVKAGNEVRTLSFVVEKTPVSSIVFVRQNASDNHVAYGDDVITACRVYPLEATYREVTYEVTEGAEYVQALPVAGNYRVITREVGAVIIIRASADGKWQEMHLVTVPIEARQVVLTTEGATSVQVGDVRTLTAQVLPADAQVQVVFAVEEGADLCTLEGNVLTFTQMDEGNDRVLVRATAGEVSGYLLFHVVPIPVTEVVISTDDPTEGLTDGDTVTFVATVSPDNASYRDVTYRLVEGSAFGTLEGNVFTVTNTTAYGQVVVEAQSADGVKSNRITLSVDADAYSPAFATWADLDAKPHLLDGYAIVNLDLRTLPYHADDTVIVVSDDVDTLTLVGNYTGSLDTCYTNLYFWFLTTDAISVYLDGVGIVIDNGFTDTVLDFGGNALVTLVVENANYIAAGNAYALSTVGYMVEGELDDLRLMDGMDGFAGQNGGTALSAYDLTIMGSGSLTLKGGDASSGTDGTDGLSTDQAATYAGDGGLGGNGGDGGYAIYAVNLTYDFTGTLALYSGASGTAGKGGLAGLGAESAYNGTRGKDGTAGVAHDPVLATVVTQENGRPLQYMGTVRQNAAVRVYESVLSAAELLANHFKVNLYYAAGWRAGHTSDYSMTQLSANIDVGELMRLMHGLEYALQTFGHKAMIELAEKSKVNYYLCASIKKGKSVIYGLTDDGNNVWYSAFETRKRDSFYSTYYNIMVHEIFHLFYFSASASTQTALNATTLASFNGGVAYYYKGSTYVPANNNSNGVYSSAADDGLTARFLTTYSKADNKEDISETLSVMSIQAQTRTFLSSASAIYQKAIYMTRTFAEEYASLDMWKPIQWLRFVR